MTEPAAAAPQPTDPSVAIINAVVASIMVLFAGWLVAADFAHRGDLLFQSSASLLLTIIAFFFLDFALLIVAALPKRIIIGGSILLLARFSFGFPLSLGLDHTTASRIMSVALLVLTVFYLMRSLMRASFIVQRKWFAAKHSLLAITILGLVGLSVLPFVGFGFGCAMRNMVGNYAEVSPRGLSLVERVFEKGGQRVHLVGMMHVGNGEFYRELTQRMAANPEDGGKRLVLTEGVSDRAGIIPEDFANGKTYERWAKFLGLEAQKSLQHESSHESEPGPQGLENPNIIWQNADIDVSDLDADHRELLVMLLEMISSGNPVDMLKTDMGDMSGVQFEDLLKNGLIGARNSALMEQFDGLASGFAEIYIPWGAAHLPDVEARLLERGYSMTSEVSRPVVEFWN